MGENSKIEWTDHTFNPWRGCTKVSAGCANCYADTMSKRNPGTLGIWGPNGSRVVASEAMWREPLKWNREAEKSGQRRRVFCASLADVFEDWDGCPVFPDGSAVLWCRECESFVKPSAGQHGASCADCDSGAVSMVCLADVRNRLFELIDSTPHLDWLLLTKRPENIRRMMPVYSFDACETGDCPHWNQDECTPPEKRKWRDNVWLGTSVENQEAANKRIPELLKCRDLSQILFLSCEPLLGTVELRAVGGCDSVCLEGHNRPLLRIDALAGCTDPLVTMHGANCLPKIDWVIAGGESGPNARPMHPDWVRSLRDQCQASDVPFLFKQWGEWHPECSANWATGPKTFRYGKVEGVAIVRDGRAALKNEREDPSGKAIVVNPMLNALSIKELKELGYQWVQKIGKTKAGRLLDGREWNEFPKIEK